MKSGLERLSAVYVYDMAQSLVCNYNINRFVLPSLLSLPVRPAR